MQVDVRQQWRQVSALRHALIARLHQAVFHDSAFQHPHYQPQHALVGDAVSQKLLQPLLIDVVKEAFDVRLYDEAYFPLLHRAAKLVYGLV